MDENGDQYGRARIVVTEERLSALARARRNQPLRLAVTEPLVEWALAALIVAMQETSTTREALRAVLADLAIDSPPADG